jgi:hypothetical protein
MSLAIEMAIEPGAEALIKKMGKRLGTKARSKVIDKTIALIRQDFHVSEVAAWFSEARFAASRRTTVRISAENADYLAALSGLTGRGRPGVLLELVYFAAAKLSNEDLESLAA